MEKVDDLLSRLHRATESKPEPVIPDEPPLAGPGLTATPLGESLQEATDPVPGSEGNPPPAEPAKPPIDSGALAETLIKFVSNVFEVGGKKVYAAAILEEGDIEKINEVNREIRLATPVAPEETLKLAIEREPTLAEVVLRFDAYHTAVKGAPFTDDEKQLLRQPLADVIEKYSWLHLGPEMILLITVCIVMTPRITPLFPGFTGLMAESLAKANAKKEGK